jgi:hypothetical protein
MTSYGEEGAVVGSAAAWENHDEVFAQYRGESQSLGGPSFIWVRTTLTKICFVALSHLFAEVGVLLWREYP